MTNWEGANLSGADMSAAILDESGFNDATLIQTNFSKARLQECSFSCANLTDACVKEAVFGPPCLDGANLTGVDFSQALIDSPGGINNPRIAGAVLCDTTLPDGGNWTL